MLKRIDLSNFRNYSSKKFEFAGGVNLVVGENAVGKTNLLEAVYLLGNGDSFRANRTEEMVYFGTEFGKVGGELMTSGGDMVNLEILISGGLIMGKRVNKKKFFVNDVPKRRADACGLLPLVLFRPEDVELVGGPPEVRRRSVDRLLVQVDKEYANSLSTYEQALKRRNKLLNVIRDGEASQYSLAFWDGLLVKHGQVIQDKRRLAVQYINDLLKKSDLFNSLNIEYKVSNVSESRLLQHREAEIAIGYTLVGPHKDDLIYKSGDRDLAVYGSRGEQRMAVLAVKMGEIYFMEDRIKQKVVLLLDDIFSELDGVHKQEVLRVMSNRQVIVTTADKNDVKMFGKVNMVSLA